ncbi:LolA family protein [Sphingomonas flavalba]|uniref:LolA family protein n=1 Tax=Sphingomonas flavalba TaxID=2559804 RepID=UPI00109E2145|nr:outer membrane lipoprotein carrier protein LolA [Sphingomonas flavalba]
MSFRPLIPAALALAPLALASAPAVQAQAPAAESDLAAVQRHMAAIQTMTADFTQTDRAGKVLTGTLTLKRPGHVRFQYEKGVPLLIVGDGKALTFIDYQVKQVSRWPIGKSPLAFILDPAKDLSKVARVVESADPRLLLVQARDPARPEFGTITLAFVRGTSGPAGLTLNGWTALDAQNNRTQIRLSNQQFNGPIDDQAFKWRDPRPAGRGR